MPRGGTETGERERVGTSVKALYNAQLTRE